MRPGVWGLFMHTDILGPVVRLGMVPTTAGALQYALGAGMVPRCSARFKHGGLVPDGKLVGLTWDPASSAHTYVAWYQDRLRTQAWYLPSLVHCNMPS